MGSIAKVSLAILALTTLLLAVFVLSGISVRIDFLSTCIEALAAKGLKHEVTIDGPIRTRLSLHPELEITQLTIIDPKALPEEPEIVTVAKGRIKLSLMSLMHNEIDIDRLDFEGVELWFAKRNDGTFNISFPAPQNDGEPGWHVSALEALRLKDVTIHYQDQLKTREYTLSIDTADGQAPLHEPLELSVTGTIEKLPYTLELSGNTLHDFLMNKAPWTLQKGQLAVADMTLNISGTIDRTKAKPGGHADVSIHGDSMDALAQIFELNLPPTGAATIDSQLEVSPGRFDFTDIRLAMTGAIASGNIALSLEGPQPTLAGNLVVSELNMNRLPHFSGNASEVRQPTDPLPLDFLRRIDAHLHLRADNIDPGQEQFSIQNFKAALSLVDGDLDVPFSFTVLDTSASGHIEIVTAGNTPSLTVSIDTNALALDGLHTDANESPSLMGELGPVSLRVHTMGENLSQLWKALDMNLALGPSQAKIDSRSLLTLDQVALIRKPSEPFVLSVVGELLNRPLQVEARIGRSNILVNSSSVAAIQLTACDSNMQIDVANPKKSIEAVTTLTFEAAGKKLCGLLRPVENFLTYAPDYSISGHGVLREDGWSLVLDQLQLGEIQADATLDLEVDEQGTPHITAKAHSSHLDMKSILPVAEENSDTASATQGTHVDGNGGQAQVALANKIGTVLTQIDKEILPHGLRIAGATSLDIQVEKLAIGTGTLSDIQLSATILDGKLKQAPFRLTTTDQLFSGDVRMDLTGEQADIGVEVSANDVDFVQLMSEFGIKKAPELTARQVNFKVALKGNTIRQLTKQTAYQLNVQDASLHVSRELSPPLRINIDTATLRRDRQGPLLLSLKGLVDGEPLSVEVKGGGGLIDNRGNEPMMLSVQADLADTALRIDSQLGEDQNNKVLRLNTSLAGDRLDNLDGVLGFNLPPLAPYAIEGSLNIHDESFELRELIIKTGESKLEGEMVISSTPQDTGGTGLPLVIRAEMNAEVIQLNDFRFKEWHVTPSENNAETTKSSQTEEAQVEDDAPQLNSLLSPELANMIKGSVSINVNQVRSGKDNLGGGHLDASIGNGVYAIDTVDIGIPGGKIHVEGSLIPTSTTTTATLSAMIDNFDYGVLARRAQPDTDLKGIFNLRVDVHSEAENISQLKDHASGHLRIAVEPEELRAGAIDLWAVNVIASALPVLMKGSKSRINCMVGEFTLDDGIMKPDVLVLDTSKIHIEGAGVVDFKANTIDIHLNPKPKSPKFFSLAIPVSVTGPLTDFHVGVSAHGVIESVFNLATGVVTVPFQKLFSKKQAEDGNESCDMAMVWVHSE